MAEKEKKKLEIANPTGNKAVDAILASLSNDFGKDMSGKNYGDVEIISTGSLRLDVALGRGGIPRGRIIEIIGDPGTLKTSLSLAIMFQHQLARKTAGVTDKMDLIIDLECSLEETFIQGFGIDMSQVIWKRPDTIEEALQLMIDLIKSGAIDCIIFDSVDAGQNEQILRKQIGEKDVGGISKDMNTALRQICKLAPNYNTTCIFINQIKMNPSPYAPPRTETGGRALLYYATLRIETKGKKPHPDVPKAGLLELEIKKTKLTSPILENVEVAFLYGKGFDPLTDIEGLAKDLEILRHSGGQTKVQWRSDSEPEPLMKDIEKGKEAALRALRENPLLLERLKHTCLRATGIKSARPDSDFTNET